jgi:hypothetical protein
MPGSYSLLFPLPAPPAFFRLLLVSSLGTVGLCPAGRGSRELAEMVEQAGPMPPTADPERLSFWVSHTKGGTLPPAAHTAGDAQGRGWLCTKGGCAPSSFGRVPSLLRSDGGRGGGRGAGGQLAAGGPAGAPGHAAHHRHRGGERGHHRRGCSAERIALIELQKRAEQASASLL